MLVHAFHERVMVDFAETPSKGDLLLGREGLVAEKDHKMLEPGGLYFPERFIIQGTQVDVGNFSAERTCDRFDCDPPIGCHGLAPFVGGILQEGSQPVNGAAWLSAGYVDACTARRGRDLC